MAYNNLQETQRAVFMAALGLATSTKEHNELMFDYLFLLGYSEPSLHDRLLAYAVDRDVEISEAIDTVHLAGVSPAAPGAPTINSAAAGNTTAEIVFVPGASNGSPVSQFTVTSSPGGIVGTGLHSPITVSGLTNGTPYTFTMTATNAIGTSPASNVSNSVTPQVPASVPTPPTALVGTRGNGQVSVAFTASSSDGGSAITGYTIKSVPEDKTATGAASPLVVTGLTNGQSYTFVGYATNAIGSSLESAASAAVTPATVPSAPVGVTAVAGFGDATVSFTPSSNGGDAVTQFTVTSSPGGLTASSTASPITVGGLTNAVEYTFTVTATNSVGTSSASSVSNAVTPNPPAQAPSAPLNLVGTRGNQQVSVAFSAPSSDGGSAITSYTVTSSPGGFQASGSASPLVVTGLTNGQSYTFTATATNANGTGPASVPSAAVVPAGVPFAPINVSATAANGQVTVSFASGGDNGAATTGYTATSNPGGLVATGSTGPLTVTGLTNGVAYTFTVTATNAVGVSAASVASNSVTPNPPTPSGPFDIYYASDFALNETNTLVPTVLPPSFPPKATGFGTASYIDNLGTRAYRMGELADLPGSDTFIRHDYARKQCFNCDGSMYVLVNGSGYFFPFDTATFTRIQGTLTVSGNGMGGIGINTAFPRTPGDFHFHPTNPDLCIYNHNTTGGLIFYEHNIRTGVTTTKFNLTSRMAGIGMAGATRATMFGEGRPSDDGRYWGFLILNVDTLLGMITYDMQTDTIIASRVIPAGTPVPNNCTMSPSGNYFMTSTHENSLNMAQCQASPINTPRGSRCYTRDLNSFVTASCTAGHCELVADAFGNDSFVGWNFMGSRIPDVEDGWTFYRRLDTGVAYQLQDYYLNVVNGHVSSCAQLRPGWILFSSFQKDTAEYLWYDDMVWMQELKPTGARHMRICHTMAGWSLGDYYAEPHATSSRDGLQIVFSLKYPGQVPHAVMIGLPSWVYGTVTPPPAVPVNTGLPTISQSGINLLTTNGTWSNSPTSYSYQWERNDGSWVAVGTNSNTYTFTDVTKQHRCTVTASNAAGAGAPATSAAFSPSAPATDLITNGTFAADTNWAKGTGWSISGGTANYVAGTTSEISQSITLVPGKDYRMKCDVTASSANADMTVRFIGGTSFISFPFRIVGTKWHILRAASGHTGVAIRASSTVTNASFDNVTLEELPTNYPILANGDFSTSDYWMSGAASTWNITGGKAVMAVAPGATVNLTQSILFEGGSTYRITFDLTRTAGTILVRLEGGGAASVSSASFSTSGAKSVDLIPNANSNVLHFRADPSFVGDVDNVTCTKLLPNLLGNGTFTDATGWTLAANCTIDTGSLHCNSPTANGTSTYAMTGGPGTYRVQYDILSPFTAGIMLARFGTDVGVISGTERQAGDFAPGTYTDDIVITGNIQQFQVRAIRSATNTMDFRIDNIIITKIA